jgi:hypothetical protein
MAIVAVIGAGGLTACSGPDAGGPETAASTFAEAVSVADGARACELLSAQVAASLSESAGLPCAQAVLQQDLPAPAPVREARVYGKQAWVITGTDTVFMSEFPGGWKVIGAGCRPESDKPYDCAVSGG